MNYRVQAHLHAPLMLLLLLTLGACSSQKAGPATKRILAEVSGLRGSGLIVQTNGANNVSVTANGSVVLAYVSSGTPYDVTVKEQPHDPTQDCKVTGGSGTIGNSDVSNVSIACTGGAHNVLASVSGLAGNGLTLKEDFSGSTPVAVTADGIVTLASQITDGSLYSVEVVTQPTNPSQKCIASSISGKILGADATVTVTCTTNTYAISGLVIGYTGSGLVLTETASLGTLQTSSKARSFAFSGSLPSGSSYSVQVATQPTSGSLFCSVLNGNSIVTNSDAHPTILCRPTTSISAGWSSTFAIKPDGTLWAWGANDCGQLGNGTNEDQDTPVKIESTSSWALVSASLVCTFALKTDGTLWAWGYNSQGQLGDGSLTNLSAPKQIGTAKGWALVSAGQYHTVALRTDGTLWTWGYNNRGQLGDGSLANQLTPKQIGTANDWAYVSAGSEFTVAVKADGSLWGWGSIASPTSDPTIPSQIGTATDWNVLSTRAHITALKTSGFLWTWGQYDACDLSDGSINDPANPEPIGNATDWALASAGGCHSAAIKTDGTLWAWGHNYYGELGDGSTIDRSSPEQIGKDTDWMLVSAGGYHNVALKTDGSLWAWGTNGNGELGNGGPLTGVLSPIRIW